MKALLAAPLLALAACAAAGVSFEDRLLATLPEGTELVDHAFWPDGRGVTYKAKHVDRSFVVVNGRRHDPYDWVIGIAVSADGRTVAYRAQHGGRDFVVVNGSPGPAFDEVGWPEISPDGALVAYAARQGHRWVLVVGDRIVDDLADDAGFAFAPTGRTLAYAAREDGRGVLVTGERRGERFDRVGSPEFSPDGRRVAYWAEDAGREFMVVDGVRGENFDRVTIPHFSPDGSTVAYLACEKDRWFAVVNGVRGEPIGEPAHRCVHFGPDGKSLVYVAKAGGQEHVVAGGRKGPDFDSIAGWGFPGLSRNGGLLTYRGTRGNDWFVVAGERVHGPVGGPHDVTPAPDGSAAIYTAKLENGTAIFRDGTLVERFSEVDHLRFGRDGRSLTYAARKDGKSFAVFEGKRGRDYDRVEGLEVSADGAVVAYEAERNRRKCVVVGEREGDLFDDVDWITLSRDGSTVAHVAGLSGAEFVVEGGRRGPELQDSPTDTHFEIGPDGRGAVHTGARDGLTRVVFKGRESAGFDAFGLSGYPVFSPDGSRVGFTSKLGGRERVVVGDWTSEPYDEAGSIAFSPDGARFAYRARLGTSEFQVLDGRRIEGYEEVGSGEFHPDTGIFSFGAGRAGKQFYVAGDRPGPPFDELGEVRYLAGGGLAYLARSGKDWFALIGERRLGPWDNAMDLTLSPDRRTAVFMFKRDGRWRAWVDGREGDPFDEPGGLSRPVFLPDGRTPAYAAKIGDRVHLVVGEHREEAGFGGIYTPAFSADGLTAAYAAAIDGRYALVVNGKPWRTYERPEELWRPVVGPDGRSVACVATRGGKQVLLQDDREGKSADRISDLTFSPDGRILACLMKRDSKLYVVAGERSFGPFDDAEPSDRLQKRLHFSPDGRRLAFGAVSGRELRWKVWELR